MIPQAFTTRDTTEAYKWLLTLPQSVRDEMKSMEQVVSLYLRAKRLGGGVPTSEQIMSQNVSTKTTQEFQRSLKNLQHELEQFELGTDPSATSQAKVADDLSMVAQPAAAQSAPPTPRQVHESSEAQNLSQNQTQTQVAVQVSTSVQNNSNAPQTLSAALRQDPKSREILNDIRDGLNLSSDLEVVRMCLALAHKSLKDLLK